MKAISLWQPWASLYAIGAKRNETRDWATSFRGRILIHAAKTKDESDYFMDPHFETALQAAGYHSFYDLPFGAIIGAVTVVDMVRTEKIRERLSESEYVFGNYEPGRFAWVSIDAVPLKAPIPCRGMQKIFEVTADVADAIRKQVGQ